MEITEVRPKVALPDGLVQVRLKGLESPAGISVLIGDRPAELLGASTTHLTVRVPETEGHGIEVSNGEKASADLTIGKVISQELHPVANPVVDRAGRIYVTYSGSRGEKVPFSVFVVEPDGQIEPFLTDITNPTALAIGPDDCLYLSSRHSGEVFRSTMDKQVEKFAENLGLATGVAFDSKGNLFVGDRSGTIHRVDSSGNSEPFCEIEPSVSAFHIAIDSTDSLYVTAPTLATQDAIYFISADGMTCESFFKGFGRPQGIGFAKDGNIQVAASYRGRKGLWSLVSGVPRQILAGPMLVGFSYGLDGSLYCVDNSTLFHVPVAENDAAG